MDLINCSSRCQHSSSDEYGFKSTVERVQCACVLHVCTYIYIYMYIGFTYMHTHTYIYTHARTHTQLYAYTRENANFLEIIYLITLLQSRWTQHLSTCSLPCFAPSITIIYLVHDNMAIYKQHAAIIAHWHCRAEPHMVQILFIRTFLRHKIFHWTERYLLWNMHMFTCMLNFQ